MDRRLDERHSDGPFPAVGVAPVTPRVRMPALRQLWEGQPALPHPAVRPVLLQDDSTRPRQAPRIADDPGACAQWIEAPVLWYK